LNGTDFRVSHPKVALRGVGLRAQNPKSGLSATPEQGQRTVDNATPTWGTRKMPSVARGDRRGWRELLPNDPGARDISGRILLVEQASRGG